MCPSIGLLRTLHVDQWIEVDYCEIFRPPCIDWVVNCCLGGNAREAISAVEPGYRESLLDLDLW